LAVVRTARVREVGFRHPHHDTDYTVSFADPTSGRTREALVTRTFVNDRNGVGRRLQVSVDPRDASLAEITGHPANSMRDWWFILAYAVAFVVAGAMGVYLLRPRRA
jgi:hypothetical protein